MGNQSAKGGHKTKSSIDDFTSPEKKSRTNWKAGDFLSIHNLLIMQSICHQSNHYVNYAFSSTCSILKREH